MNTTLLTPDQVRDQLKAIGANLRTRFFERGSVIDAMTLAVLSKQHVFILGEPGTGKSALIRSYFDCVTGATYFEAVLSKTRPAEAVVGPYDIPELRDNGHLFRKINGFLPTANFAMLDEIGKMPATLGHDLLAVVNERRLHQVNGGRSWIDVPLYSFFAGSNELPTEESDDAAAMWDRMLVRIVVERIQEPGNFVAMLGGAIPGAQATPPAVDFESLKNVIDNVVPNIALPRDVGEALVTLRDNLRNEEIAPSDRRWKQSVALLQAAAFMEGRTEISVDDIGVLRHTLWDTPQQINKVERMTLSVSNPFAEAALDLLSRAEEIAREVQNAKALAIDHRAKAGVELNNRLKSITVDLDLVMQKAKSTGMSTSKLDEVKDKVAGIKGQVLAEVLGVTL
jgi:MoxR-like ATPase